MSAHALTRDATKNQGGMDGPMRAGCWPPSVAMTRYRREWGLKKGRRRALRRVSKDIVLSSEE
jgi:hypothetical protein